MDVIQELSKNYSKNLLKTIDFHVKEGIKRKGFEFNSKEEFHIFLSERCNCHIHTHLNKKIFFIDQKPFLIHEYNEEEAFSQNTDDPSNITFTLSFGNFKFINT